MKTPKFIHSVTVSAIKGGPRSPAMRIDFE